jgi:hypothetical protein
MKNSQFSIEKYTKHKYSIFFSKTQRFSALMSNGGALMVLQAAQFDTSSPNFSPVFISLTVIACGEQAE